jgi:prolyl oligopeptidase
MKQPAARVATVYDEYFGERFADDYRWMEDWQSEESMTWIKGQAAYTRSYLDALPDRAALLADIEQLSRALPRLSDFQLANGRLFYQRRDGDEGVAKLMMRPDVTGPERCLLDPNQIEGEVHHVLDWYKPSSNGRYLVYGLSTGGSEQSTLYVLDVDSGQQLADTIPHTDFCQVTWVDEETFLYTQYPASRMEQKTDYFKFSHLYLHRLGEDPDLDPLVLGDHANGVTLDAVDIPRVELSPTSQWVIGQIIHGDSREFSLYAAPRQALATPEAIPWVKLVGPEAAVVDIALHGDTLYLRTHCDAPRFQVKALSLTNPDFAAAPVIVPPSELVIEAIYAVQDSLLTLDMDGGITRLRRTPLAGGEPELVPLPVEGTVETAVCEATSLQVLLPLTSWMVSPRLYVYDLAAGTLTDTGIYPPSPIDMSDLETHELLVPAPDGARIPLSLIHRKGLVKDGRNPTMLMGYGSYGITIRPSFVPVIKAWFDCGGVAAFAHIRGGGVYGREWHEAGRMLNKHNTINDFITCAEYLIEQQITRPSYLAGIGGSAGGIPTGGALVRRPDLWAVMVIRVGLTDALRAELTPNGPPNVLEFGTATTEEGFAGLKIINSYARVGDGTAYPAVLLTTGLNDPRIVPWMMTKMAARLQAATASNRPVLLRVTFDAGHGIGSTRKQENEEWADLFAFLLEQFDR